MRTRVRVLAVPLIFHLANSAVAGGLKAEKLQADSDLHRYVAFSKPLSKEQQFDHALERFTFGSRPRDIATLRTTGLKKWL